MQHIAGCGGVGHSQGSRGKVGKGRREGNYLGVIHGYGLGLGVSGAVLGRGTCVRESRSSGLNPGLANISSFGSGNSVSLKGQTSLTILLDRALSASHIKYVRGSASLSKSHIKYALGPGPVYEYLCAT